LRNSRSQYRKSFNKQGFITVEAAIFLPIFIIGVLTLAYLIKFLSIQEAVFHSFTDQSRVLASESFRNPVTAPLFELQLKDRIYSENGENIEAVDVEHFRYLYETRGMSGMISMDLNYDVNINLPISFREKITVSESLLYRGFIGKEEVIDPIPFDEMEKVKASDLVWIFPRSGGKYHGENCPYITSEPKQMVMSGQIRRKYEPCSICNSAGLPDGSLVYCFKTGHSYHSGDCPIVDKYVISIEKEEAIERGYTACMKCGGN
jgi:hypothetical protein